MRPDTIYFAINLMVMIIGLLLFVFFGQKTVRKLRKNPITRNSLGIEFFSGYDIVNVMAALALPKKLTRILKKSPLSALHADAELIDMHTTRFDRILAMVSSILITSSIMAMLLLMLLLEIGVFKQ